jgi:hypothetical protein
MENKAALKLKSLQGFGSVPVRFTNVFSKGVLYDEEYHVCGSTKIVLLNPET